GLHPARHPGARARRCGAGQGLAVRRTADPFRDDGPGALAAGRLAEPRAGVRGRGGEGARRDRAAAAVRRGDGRGRGAAGVGLGGEAGGGGGRGGRALVRGRALLGSEGVYTAVLGEGRGPEERVRLVPWGEERGAVAHSAGGSARKGSARTGVEEPAPWPGR